MARQTSQNQEGQNGFPQDDQEPEEPEEPRPEPGRAQQQEPAQTPEKPVPGMRARCKYHGDVTPIIVGGGPRCPQCKNFVKILEETPEKPTPPGGVEEGAKTGEGEGEAKPPEPGRPLSPVDEMRQDMRRVLEEELDIMPGTGKPGIQYVMKRFEEQANLAFELNELYALLVRRFPKANPQDIFDLMKHVAAVRNSYNFDAGTMAQYMNWNPPGQMGGALAPPNWNAMQLTNPTLGMYNPMWPGQQWGGQQQTAPQVSLPPREPEKRYTIVVDGQTVETTESGLRAWSQYKKEQQLLDQQIKAAEEERDRRNKEWDLRLKQIEKELAKPTTVQVPGEKEGELRDIPLQALPYMNLGGGRIAALEQELTKSKDDLHKAELAKRDTEIEDLRDKVDSLARVASPEALDERAERMGWTRTQSPIYGIAREGQQDFHEVVTTVLNRIRPPGGGGGARYTEEERAAKTGEVLDKLGRARRLAEIEAQIIAHG